MSLPHRIATVVNEELEVAFYQAGRRILSLYLEDMAQAKLAALKQADLVKILNKILAESAMQSGTAPVSGERPRERTRAILDLLERALDLAPLSGITLADATKLIRTELAHSVKPGVLVGILRRHRMHHKMAVRRGRIQFQASILVDKLNRQRAAALRTLDVGERG